MNPHFEEISSAGSKDYTMHVQTGRQNQLSLFAAKLPVGISRQNSCRNYTAKPYVGRQRLSPATPMYCQSVLWFWSRLEAMQ